MQKSRCQATQRALLFWTLFIGLGAVLGAVCMLLSPSGAVLCMDGMLPYFQVLPLADRLFQDYTFSGIALLLVNGLPNLLAAWLLHKRRRAGILCGMAFGITLMLWICIQFYIFPFNFLSTAYFIFGLIQAITGYAAWVFARQEAFAAQTELYPHVGQNAARLVVYFSRMGYVRRLAMQQAERTGAQIYEIQTDERTQGTLGFWWCGHYGLCRMPMPIAPIPAELRAYEHVTICSPIWVFGMCAPIRAFCMQARGKIHSVDYVLVHHTKGMYQRVAHEMDALLGIKHTALTSICCRKGVYAECTSDSRRHAKQA